MAQSRCDAVCDAAMPDSESEVRPFIRSYCLSCHGQESRQGGLDLEALQSNGFSASHVETWEQVLDRIQNQEMPPEDAKQPSDQERMAVTRWIDRKLRDALEREGRLRAPTIRRLTNLEYQNTLRDLLGFQIDVMDELPQDPEVFYEFNHTAELMRIGPEQLNRYLEIARRVMTSAIVSREKPEIYRARREWTPAGNDRGLGQDEVGVWGNRRNTAADGMNLRGFPKTGQFRIRVKASAIRPSGFDEVPLNLDLGTPPGRTETPYKTVATLYLTNAPDEPQVFELTGRIENHPYAPTRIGKRGELVDQMAIRPRVIFDDGTLNDGGTYANVRQLTLPRAVVHWIEFEAPVTDEWPPRHHTAILFDSPLRQKDPNAYVRKVLARFMTRAYRRPVMQSELDRFEKVYQLIRPGVPSLEDAIRETLAMVLVSPPFIHRMESESVMDEHYAMASRLSYFLWGSMPDQELLDLAADQRLADPQVIRQQVVRLLADERSTSFVQNFTLQWLSIKKSLTVPINQDLYPRFLHRVPNGETAGTEVPYRPTVRDYMIEESIGFVAELIRRDASVFNIVDSNFVYINERLAAHYGVKGVRGMQMRPVAITPEHHLGGLLTQGSVLIGNGTGTAPHPIYRAVWLREAILGDRVPDPPSEVPALTDTAGESLEKAVSIVDLLAQHRTVKSCNDCHARLDPWGIPFEQYNAIGRFQQMVPKDGVRVRGYDASRDGDLDGYAEYLQSINHVVVDSTTQIPRGPEVDGIRQLKDYLLTHRRDDIAKNMIRRMLAYGIGRDLTYRDRSAVEKLFNQTQPSDFKLREILIAICQSDIFRATDSKGMN